ncbi:MAG: class III extradiol ring-cleavage dioxygenase [Firmicutes bacterium]|nr:class III extradiol ring-cleavage dioxygenase [Bacillota bacterium]
MLPSLFIAHGSPMLAIEDNEYSQFLGQLHWAISRPRAIVLFSAHWLSLVQQVSASQKHTMMYDFGGFPQELYSIEYPASGDATLSQEIASLLGEAGVPCQLEAGRGLDHGAWVVLRRVFPDADIPVIAMSVNPRLKPEQQYAIGQALAALRSQDVLLIGSGGTVHNLRALAFSEPDKIDDWAVTFDDWITKALQVWDLKSLFSYAVQAPHASLAVPPGGNEHLVPLFYAMGAADHEQKATLLHRSYQFGNLSHTVWQFG